VARLEDVGKTLERAALGQQVFLMRRWVSSFMAFSLPGGIWD
jgi:hypothetical protein